MGTEIFKQKYGETGPSCGSPFSDYFNVKQPIIVNKTKRTL